jgi:hypothetical protein
MYSAEIVTKIPRLPYPLIMLSFPFGIKAWAGDQAPKHRQAPRWPADDRPPTRAEIHAIVSNIQAVNTAPAYNLVAVCPMESVHDLIAVLEELFQGGTNKCWQWFTVNKRGKARPAGGNGQFKLESCQEVGILAHHDTQTGKRSLAHFPGLGATSWGNCFNDTHLANKFKSPATGQVQPCPSVGMVAVSRHVHTDARPIDPTPLYTYLLRSA